MVETAKREGDARLELLVQTICATDIRVSEVLTVTVESLGRGQVELRNKGRIRSFCCRLGHTSVDITKIL